MKQFLTEAFARLTSDVPVFFRKLQIMGAGVAAVGAALLAVAGAPEQLKTVATTMIWVGGTIAAVGQFPCKDPQDTNTPTK